MARMLTREELTRLGEEIYGINRRINVIESFFHSHKDYHVILAKCEIIYQTLGQILDLAKK